MLKQLIKVIPYLSISWGIWGIVAILEAYLLMRVTGVLDEVMSGKHFSLEYDIMQMLILVIMCVPFAILHSYTFGIYKKKANKEMKTYYLKKVFGKDISEFHKENNAKYLSGITNDLNNIEINLIENSYEIGRQIIVFITGMMMIGSVEPSVAKILVSIVVFNIFYSNRKSKPVAKDTNQRSERLEAYTSYIKEVLAAFHIIKSNNLQERVKVNFEDKSHEVQQKGYMIEKKLSYIQASQHAMMNGFMYAILLVGAYLAISGKASIGATILIVQGAQRVMWPGMIISEKTPQIFVVKDLIKKVEETLRNTNTYEEKESFEGLQDEISLKKVSFGYEDGLILDEVDLILKKGGKYLVVGPSGGGKSTLLKLLRKYFNPTHGEILVDGKSLKHIKKEDFFRHIANVEQQVFIFEDTIRNNITLYKKYTEEEINEVLLRAGLTEFIAQLPKGLETMIYDNGSNISGGERSRVVIARGLLAKASVLFLDEAFAALDLQRAKEIEEIILELEDITVINVSHVIIKENQHRYTKVLSVKHQKVTAIT